MTNTEKFTISLGNNGKLTKALIKASVEETLGIMFDSLADKAHKEMFLPTIGYLIIKKMPPTGTSMGADECVITLTYHKYYLSQEEFKAYTKSLFKANVLNLLRAKPFKEYYKKVNRK